ncbi:HAMP domain-containing sensor histidine kinase [Actinocatenispora rupis]|uniref:Signal transduction histidine-protein kinase/phosphatase MprB n=1 Tax=Actinocatenispora rupis TaxID=519421 RepID=A0A8J3JH72_9ACTN|nr:HAMP domain-containing sensor histidine kinase [Actinocatenispora rupis]GID14853.1 putative histidine kinase sensor of two-component system [Actinocatenispora rupis]
MIRPLDRIGSIKLKIGVLVTAAICAASAVFWLGIGTNQLGMLLAVLAIAVALVVTQVLAHGMTSPLRDMTAAAGAMARGDYTRRVRASSRDEVGELARAFNRMADDLAVADRQRRELIANVSHELRTPISALQAVLENVVDGVSDPSELRTALAQTERLGRLVSELLDMSRLDAGVVPLRRELLDAEVFLADVVAQSGGTPAADGAPARFEIRVVPPDLTMYADPQRLHQVLANLVDNACRHGPPGGLVSLSAARTDDGVALEVRDEGPGIRTEDRERVFERFIRGAPARGDGGTGLGLAIARWAVDLHGGTIGVVGPGPGCRIRVTLPAP